MYITREQFEELRNDYKLIFLLDNDIPEALRFVQDLLYLEAQAIKKAEPHATRTISRLEEAAHDLFEICMEIENEEFNPV